MIDVRRASGRFTTTGDGVESRHSFSFGTHYDPTDVGFAVLVAHNEDRLAPRAGYDTHPHADTEILTWVLEGSLVHRDSEGHDAVLTPGVVQRLSAGRGVLHSERNDVATGSTRFVQMWLRPDETGLEPSYAQAAVGAGRGLVPLASGIAGLQAPVGVHTSGAALHLARLAAGESIVLPDAAHLHVFVARGAVDLEGAGRLGGSDAARFTGEGGPRLTGAADAPGGAEVLVWQLPQALSRGLATG